ncbi:hypothetical protein [Nocardioides sp. B-3]|uniref:hypothetical protein n=1 Tax=Nocardioides sp. B-3 TaxID=2895565 RepID=UPI002152167E|nr:hypothetical protein [Nocardioides sp. B-3]UUZ60717.1 hypothetical protein LP418_07900 [Nocardioides sp. B-3]
MRVPHLRRPSPSMAVSIPGPRDRHQRHVRRCRGSHRQRRRQEQFPEVRRHQERLAPQRGREERLAPGQGLRRQPARRPEG